MHITLKITGIVLFLTSLSDQCRSSVPRKINITSLPVPEPKYLNIKDPAHVIVRWDPVEVSEDNPILGFKVKLWEDEKEKITQYVEKDGELVKVEEWVPVKKAPHTIPSHAPAFEAIVPPDIFQAAFDVRLGEHYDLRAQSYSVQGDGPLSTSHGFRIHTDEETRLYQATSVKPPPGEKVKATVLSLTNSSNS